jgi:hypothetical protein
VVQNLATTFKVLAKTDNKTAVRVLLPALDSPHTAIQEGALVALLNRREPAGQREILSRIADLPHHWKTLIHQNADRMTGVLRAALLDEDESLCLNACRAAVMFEDYEVIPALLAAMEKGSRAKADMAAETLLQLAVGLYDELEHSRNRSDHRDPAWSRRHVMASLENAVQRFGRHKRREVVEAFLLLTDRKNAVLNQILRHPHHLCFLIMIDVFSKSEQGGVMRLLLTYLDEPRPPTAVLGVISNRCDPKFVRYLLRHLGLEFSPAVRQNLKRIENLAWLKSGGGIIDYLDNAAQLSAVHLIMAAGIPRNQAFATIKHLLLHGKPAGRREAANALANFNGADANALVLSALDDADPQVQANILAHIRQRAIPGILPRLVQFMDSPHLVVRRAAQQCLAEYSFPRFVNSFDMLDEEVQRSTGVLVKKVDPQTLPLLREELLAATRSRRIRGLQIAAVLELAEQVEPLILELLHDADPEVRSQAAQALAECRTPAGRRALTESLQDASPLVRQAAQRSLQ